MRTPDNEAEGTEAQTTEAGSTGGQSADPDVSPLANGFRGSDGGSGDADAFGSGWPGAADSGSDEGGSGDGSFGGFADGSGGSGFGDASEPDEPSFLQAPDDGGFDGVDELGDAGADELSAFEFDRDYFADTDDNLDFDGDGTTEGHDADAFVHGLSHFQPDPDDPHSHAENHGLLDPP
jgi:hypothetical protein